MTKNLDGSAEGTTVRTLAGLILAAGMSWLASVVVFLGVVVFPGAALAQSEHCSAFTADQIDTLYSAWRESIGFVPDAVNAICYDDPTAPAIRFEANEIRTKDALLLIFVQGASAGCIFRLVGDETSCFYIQKMPLAYPVDGHSCRAEILRSDTWRQLCKDVVGPGQAQN